MVSLSNAPFDSTLLLAENRAAFDNRSNNDTLLMPTLCLPLLTPTQEKLLRLIEREQIAGRNTPTFRELAEMTGRASPGPLVYHINNLYKKGYLKKKHRPDERRRGFEVIAPIVAPRYIGAIDLHDGSLHLGEPKKIPHCNSWEGCVGLELLRDDLDKCRVSGDILILKPIRGYSGQSLGKLDWWGKSPEQMVFDQNPGKAFFDLVGLWRFDSHEACSRS